MKTRCIFYVFAALLVLPVIRGWAAPPPHTNESSTAAGQAGNPDSSQASYDQSALQANTSSGQNSITPASAGCFDGPGGSPTDAMCIYPSGFVGIGTTTPAQNALQIVTGGGAFNTLGDGVHLGLDSGGNTHIELVKGGGGTPYIDFLSNNIDDFHARLILSNPKLLSLQVSPMSINLDATVAGSEVFNVISADIQTNKQLKSTFPTASGPPLVVTSTAEVTNLNANLLEGSNAAAFALLAGRAGGQILDGGTAASENLTLDSTANATKGFVLLNPSGGNVGIGTTTPTSALHVVGDALITGTVNVHFVNGNSPLQLQTGGVTRVFIDDAPGNVGIGTTTPGQKLDVIGGSISSDTQLISTVATGTAPLAVTSTTKVTNLNVDSLDGRDESEFALLAGRAGGQFLDGGTAASENLSLDSTANATKGFVLLQPTGGNVGVGTTTPTSPLHVVGDAKVTGKVITDFVTSNSPLQLQTGGTTRVYIDDVAGNVGIGTVTPGQKLDVVGGSIRTDTQLISTVPTGTAPLSVASTTKVTNLNADLLDGRDESEFALLAGRPGGQTLEGGTGPAEQLVLDSTSNATKGFVLINPNGGNVGIGTTQPSEALEVNGCVKATCFRSTSSTIYQLSSLGMVKFGTSNLTMLPNLTGTMTIQPTAAGPQFVMMPVDMPNQLMGTFYLLNSIRVCYKVSSGSSYINRTSVRIMNDTGSFTSIVNDTTTRNSTVWNCYTVSGGGAAIAGPLYIAFDLTESGTGAAHNIEIGKITLDLGQ